MEDVQKLLETEWEAVNDGALLRRKTPTLFERKPVEERIEALENELIATKAILSKMDELGVK